MLDLTHPHYQVASPLRRACSAAINFTLFGVMTQVSKGIATSAVPVEEAQSIERILIFGFGTVFWLVCGFARSSPGARFCQLFICCDNRSTIRWRTALLRSAPYYAFILPFAFPTAEASGAKTAMAIIALINCGFLLVNFASLWYWGGTFIDRWLNVTVLTLKLPGHHIPKVLGISIKR